MRIDIHHHFDCGDKAPPWAEHVIAKLGLILNQTGKLMATMAELQAAVTRNTDAGDAVIVLLQGISQQLKDAQGDPTKIAEVIASLDAETQRFSDAVTANTPSA